MNTPVSNNEVIFALEIFPSVEIGKVESDVSWSEKIKGRDAVLKKQACPAKSSISSIFSGSTGHFFGGICHGDLFCVHGSRWETDDAGHVLIDGLFHGHLDMRCGEFYSVDVCDILDSTNKVEITLGIDSGLVASTEPSIGSE